VKAAGGRQRRQNDRPHGHKNENGKQEESEGMFHKTSSKPVFTVVGLVAAIAMLWANAGTVRAQELDESLKIDGEVAFYFESTNTNFAGNYTEDVRGQGAWGGFFGPGLKDTYSFNETRFKEAELHVQRAQKFGESWVMTNRIELEFKTVNTNADSQSASPYNDIDVEEASAKFLHSSGLYVDLGILQDSKVYTPGLLLDMAAGDDKGFDENPALRVGFKTGDLNVSLRYTSQFVAKDPKQTVTTTVDNGDGTTTANSTTLAAKSINQTMLHAEAMYKIPDLLNALLMYTTISSANKENKDFQSSSSAAAGSDTGSDAKKAYEDAGLDDTTLIQLSLAFTFGTIIPYLNVEQWHVDQTNGATSYDTQILTLGVNLKDLGPGDLIVATEQGTMSGDFYQDPKKTAKAGKPVFADVKFTGYALEYLFHAGKSVFGPGFKTFSNDAPGASDTLTGSVIYFASKFTF
jgi:hypothetical protein